MMHKLPISVCLIAGAEEARIGRTLESVSGWVAEIVVVLNSEVSDATEEIALRHGARVYREPWKGFRDQKNSAAAKATQPWVLNLDADEAVSPALRDEIQRVIPSPSSGAVAYSFPRLCWYCGRWIRHGDWYPDRVTRLWRAGQARWEGDRVHERLEVSGPVGRLAGDLLHYSNDTINGQLAKIGPYADLFVARGLAEKRRVGLFDLAVRPLWKFIRAYIFRLGFLDGWPGYYIAWVSAFSTVTRYVKIREAALR